MNRREFVKASVAVVGAIAVGNIPAIAAPVKPLIPLNGWICNSDYINWKTPKAEAGIIVADAWKNYTGSVCGQEWKDMCLPENIDMWGYDDIGQQFVDAFFSRCKENGLLREALHVKWHFHCCPGPESWATLYDYFPEWTKDFLNRTEGKSYYVNPAIYREFSLKDMCDSETCHFEQERKDPMRGNEPWRDLI